MSRFLSKDAGAICEWGDMPDKLSTNTYADVGIWGTAYFKTKYLTFKATTNNLLVAVLGSRDGGVTYPATLENDISVTTATEVEKSYTALYSHLKIQVKAATGGLQGTLTTKFYGTWI